MFRLPRPLIVALGVIPPALMILTEHPWMGAATFAAVFTIVLLKPRTESGSEPAPDPRRDDDDPVRELVASDSLPIDDEEPPRPRDGLIHYPPRRLPL